MHMENKKKERKKKERKKVEDQNNLRGLLGG